MKVKCIGVLLGLTALLLFQAQAHAAYFTINRIGEVDVAGVSTIDFDVMYTVEASDPTDYFAWDLDFAFDSSELSFVSASNLANGAVSQPDTNTLNLLYLDPTGSTSLIVGSNLFATFTFDVVTPSQFFDGLPDFIMLASTTGDKGMGALPNYNQLRFGEVAGADVGVVPIPGAIWLLGSGFAVLAAVQRRRNS